MTFFMTKVWGWEAPVGPLQFSTEGWRRNARAQLSQGDFVVLVGTTGDQTPEAMKGRILGMMQPSDEPVMALDFDVRQSADDFVDGEYKWPFGLLNTGAWTSVDRPLLSEISDRRFSMDSAQGIVPLTDEEAARIEALEWKPEPLLEPTARAQHRLRKRGGGQRAAPPPSTTTRQGVMHMRRAPAHTYVMEVGGADKGAFKIGWAFDYVRRQEQFNKYSMPALGGLSYCTIKHEIWDTAQQAFAMEQAVLERLAAFRTAENMEVVTGVTRDELDRIWIECFMSVRARTGA